MVVYYCRETGPILSLNNDDCFIFKLRRKVMSEFYFLGLGFKLVGHECDAVADDDTRDAEVSGQIFAW